MMLNVYSFYDSAAKAYTQPFFLHNDGLAIRAFQSNVNDESGNNNIANNPDQFTLYRIGQYDDVNGELIPTTPESLGNGVKYQDKIKVTDKHMNAIFDEIKEIKEALGLNIRVETEVN